MIYFTSANPFRDPIWAQWIQPALATLVDPASFGHHGGSSQRWSLAGLNQIWSLYKFQPGLVNLVNYASAGPLVDPATAGPITEEKISQIFTRKYDQFIKLFRLLLSRGLCPVICRLIATLYTIQTSRVKWGSSFSETFSISNGVKQGGVLSPILFGVYINSLLDKLEHSRAGCYIGHIFMGAFGYADDIILLAPCKKSLCVLLDICKQFSLEFQVNFNSSKSKLIVFSNANDCDTSVLFNNQMISSVSSEQHLGHIIGNQVSQECIRNITNDFIKRVNVLSAVFKFTFSETKYFLFKVFLYVFIRKCTVGFFVQTCWNVVYHLA